ncbi:tRNA uridine-5-carboxymethylaminomethyl(34) synthesis enzyme MnmG [Listeria welshimeri]|uniref:tRNA uridine 5-carboxymethylaminomethyl modification enzyme MnmG n=1 Tax=Listeria welshimeri serovar 6b (strain ATCC 35897 / DSM 20650 / CCUG 15529 / CIP 8149 / NCTC 11857 / SLCC 5334 / V8) TaxID=386043 RepID=MNMG_LISW6|nr:tRNA uridine-5-carboxymethylaminomethyl(34) synthesis enzyme MnmG [Listeria welshimeri]A0AMD1.1 RecName: Full=tRNA uridine 5-carboxymethylaminomethyl modification enzyme MnmG; AltName: Full=Glucose-inhibited division protein A [Listeria welshimeri serovar 6b str. SLCC5334]MBC1244522.1 tRNA uridine-5-carboxymethylaminomethyl(34) synthesis enzyme MnmG [Listeria welshimeri]MBC1248919.1 tRNA uridine-5-carboxymethylaminomethyl(34) synthesis enzyme MnmG [Listeria welshimeri]MBC1252649.1 tRNA uridi
MQTYDAGTFDVIVVGAGHAGVEAGLASGRMGAKTLMLTINLDMVAFMPCNPSVGGPAKGVVVREIDALGGEMGRNTDKTYIQMRMLNTGKGPAVRALRAQADKWDYQHEMKHTIEKEENITLRQGLVDHLVIEDGVCKGVITNSGAIYYAKTVVITTGTFSRGEIIVGELRYSSGPNNQQPSVKLSEHLEELGFELRRFKTGTPPRVKSSTIDYSKTEEQPGDDHPRAFSFDTVDMMLDQLPCWLTYTNETTHEIIQANLHRSPMFTATKKGTGARYCPSIEDKIVRFSDKPRHQIFLEPEGKNTEEVYVQGLSTSLPEEVQREMLRTIPGLENVEMMRVGYAIEYDAVMPDQLWPSLETKLVEGLFTAGQINGTSGYEEAAGQGLMAGINAARKVFDKEPIILGRDQAYIGVLIDDLVTKGTEEPYRLLTSRAEYRLLLRHDNADLRLTEIGHEIGLISDERYERFLAKQSAIEAEKERLQKTRIKPTAEVQAMLKEIGSGELKDGILAADLLRRPEITYDKIAQIVSRETFITDEIAEQVEIQVKYEGYIQKSNLQVEKMKRMEDKKIPENIDYDAISGLATEALEKLKKIEPLSIAQASRISGVNPADISILLVYIEQGKIAKISK